MKFNRRSLFKLVAAAPAAKAVESHPPDDHFVYHTKHRIDMGWGPATQFTKVYRRHIQDVTSDSGPWSPSMKLMLAQRDVWEIGEPELLVNFDERIGPGGHGRTIAIYGHQAKRFLKWWRGMPGGEA